MRWPAAWAAAELDGGGRKAVPSPRGPLLVKGRGGARGPLAGAWPRGRSPSAGRGSGGPRARCPDGWGSSTAESRPLGSVVVVSRGGGSSMGQAWEGWKAEPRPLGSVLVVGRSPGLSPLPRRPAGRAPPLEPWTSLRNLRNNGQRPDSWHRRHAPGSAPGPRGEGWEADARPSGTFLKGRPGPTIGDRLWREGDGWGAGERPSSPFLVRRLRPGTSPGRPGYEGGASSPRLLDCRRAESSRLDWLLGGRPRTVPSTHHWSEGAASPPQHGCGRQRGPASFSYPLAGRPSTAPSVRHWLEERAPLPRFGCERQGGAASFLSLFAGRPSTAPSIRHWSEGAAPPPQHGSGRQRGPASFSSPLARRPSTAPSDRNLGLGEERAPPPNPSRRRGAESFPLSSNSFNHSSPYTSARLRCESGGRKTEPPLSSSFWPSSSSPRPPAPYCWEDEAPPLNRKAGPPSPRSSSWAGNPRSCSSWLRSEGTFLQPSSPPGLRKAGREEPWLNFRSDFVRECSPGVPPSQQPWSRGVRGAASNSSTGRRTAQSVAQPTSRNYPDLLRPKVRNSASLDRYWRDSRDPPLVADWKAEPRSLESLLLGRRNPAPRSPYWLKEGVASTRQEDSWKPKAHLLDPLLFGKQGSVSSPPYRLEGGVMGPHLEDSWKPRDHLGDSKLFGKRGSAPSSPYWPEGRITATPLVDCRRSQPHPQNHESYGKRSPAPAGPYWLDGGATSLLRNDLKAKPRPLDFVLFDKKGSSSNFSYLLEDRAAASSLRNNWQEEPRSLDCLLPGGRNPVPLAKYWSEGGAPPDRGFGIGWKEEPSSLNSQLVGWRSTAPLARGTPTPGLGIFWKVEPRTVHSSASEIPKPAPQEAQPTDDQPLALGSGTSTELRPHSPPELESPAPRPEAGATGQVTSCPQAR